MIKKSKIKIVHSVEYWLPQTMTWLFGQISNLPDDSCENIIVCERTMNLEQFPVSNIYSLNEESLVSSFYRRALRRLNLKVEMDLLDNVLQKEKPDILHSHFGHFGWLNHKLALKHKIKHVVSFYGVDVNMLTQQKKWRVRYKEMFKHIDLCLCEGPFMKSCIEKLGCSPDKVVVQRLGVDLRKIHFVPRLFNEKEQLRFLIAGTFREKKGIPYALEMLGLYKEHNSHFVVTLIGDAGKKKFDIFHSSQNEKKKILEVIEKYGLQENIQMLGFISHSEMIKEAYNSHIFISPSVTARDGDTEGGAPVGIIEMAAGGMPVISTTHCDIPYVLGELNRKILAKERDTNGLLDNLMKFMNYSNIQKQELAKTNRTYIETYLDVVICAHQLLEKYKNL